MGDVVTQWQVRAEAQRAGGTAVVVLGADDRGVMDIMDVVQGRLPAGEWDVTAEPVSSRDDRWRPAPSAGSITSAGPPDGREARP